MTLGGRAVKQQILGVALVAIGLSVSAANADTVRMAQAIPGMLPASEVGIVVRSAGFVPISPAMRRGESYVLRAMAPDGREMRVIVGARSGEIVSASPVMAAGPTGERLGSYERMDGPPGYVPPPILHESDRPMARPMAPVPGAPPRTARVVPEPRGYGPPVVMREEREERGEHGLLPPPPDRYPPRAAAPPAERPAAKPAPVKRVAATPLPKPKPAETETPTGEVKRWGDEQDKPAASAAPAPTAPAPAPAAPEPKVDARAVPH
jgi:hypothetical protein